MGWRRTPPSVDTAAMSRGQTWGSDEVKALLEIWAEDNISKLLVETHKNTDVFKLFSNKLKERGIDRSGVQCRLKVKKLRQNYLKVRDLLRKSGSSGDVKDKCPWFDELDGILSTRPTSNPQNVMESYSPPTPTPTEEDDTSYVAMESGKRRFCLPNVSSHDWQCG